MNIRFVVTVLVGTVVMFGLGFVVFGVLLESYYRSQMSVGTIALMKEPPVLWAIALSNLVAVFLLTFIFEHYANIRTATAGAIAGGIISFLIVLSVDLSFFAFMKMFSLQFALIDSVINGLFGAIIGSTVACLLGYKREATT